MMHGHMNVKKNELACFGRTIQFCVRYTCVSYSQHSDLPFSFENKVTFARLLTKVTNNSKLLSALFWDVTQRIL